MGFSKEPCIVPTLVPSRLVTILLLIFMGSTSTELENLSVVVVLARQNRGVKCWHLVSSFLLLWCSGKLFIFSLFPHWRSNSEFFLKLS